VSASTVFTALLLVACIEAAWFLQPVWRGSVAPTVVLADATPSPEPDGIGETSARLLRQADAALSQGRWAEAGAAFDRAAELDASPPTVAVAAARVLLGIHRLDEAALWARQAVALAPVSVEALTVLATALDWGG
jgi:Flp pilus assembly protein TadD